MSKQPPEVKILWGHATRTMNWLIETPDRGRQVIAMARPNSFYVRDLDDIPNINNIAEEVHAVWVEIREGKDPATWATHQLKPPYMRDIEPVEAP